MAVTFSTINSPHSWDVQPFESLDAEGAARMLNRLQSMNEHMQRDIDKLRAENDGLRACVVRAIEMTEEAWDELTYGERSMLRPTLTQWRRAVGQPARPLDARK